MNSNIDSNARIWLNYAFFFVCFFFFFFFGYALRKHAYPYILRILPPINENFQMKDSANFHISAQNLVCGYLLESTRRGDSNKYQQSMFLSKNKKINVYLCKLQFYCVKVGFKGVRTTGVFS